MKYAVIGAGGVGRSLILDVWEKEPDAEILAIDPSPQALEALRSKSEGRALECASTDAADIDAVAEAIAECAVVANCTDGARSLDILDAAIKAGVNYVDVHGTLLVEERFARSDRAEQAGITALVGMGCSPGISNMLGAHGARGLEGDVYVDVEYVTLRPINPSGGLLETALRQFRDPVRAPVYKDGELTGHLPFEGLLRTTVPGISGEVELIYTPHSEPNTIPRFVKGLKRVTVRGTYHPEIMTLLRSLSSFGLLNPDLKVTVGGEKVDFQPLLREALMGDGSPKPQGIDPRYVLRVRVAVDDGSSLRITETTIGDEPGWHPLPQANLTALPTSFSVMEIANGRFRAPGVVGPELFSDNNVEECLSHLRSRGVWIHRVSIEDGRRSAVA